MSRPATEACSILVVEDDRELRETLCDVLTEARLVVVTAVDGLDALNHLNAGLRPQVILLDLHMPHMDGFELLRQLHRHARHAAIPVIVMTALSATVAQCFDAVAVLRKPIDVRALMQTIEPYCPLAPPPGEARRAQG
jgi:CheY-like chemotaxis protein